MPPPISEKKHAAVEKVDNRSRNFIVKPAALRRFKNFDMVSFHNWLKRKLRYGRFPKLVYAKVVGFAQINKSLPLSTFLKNGGSRGGRAGP